MSIQDVLAQALKESFLKERLRDVSLWSFIVRGDSTSNSGPFTLNNITAAMADELAVVLRGKLDPPMEHTAISCVLPQEIEVPRHRRVTPSVEVLDPGELDALHDVVRALSRCEATLTSGNRCSTRPKNGSRFCGRHQKKPTATGG